VLFLVLVTGLIALHYRGVAGVALCWVAASYASAAFVPAVGHDAEASGWAERLGFLRNAFRFGLRSHLGAVTQYMQHRVDVLIVGYFCSLRDVGIYSLAVTMAELLWYLPNTVANVLIPHVARSSDEDASRLTSTLCRAIVFVTTTLSVAMAAVGALVIPIILPAFKPSIHVLWLLLPGAVCCSVFKVLSSDLNGRGCPLETFHPAAIALGFCVFAGVLVTPRFGIMGAAAVTSVGYLVNTVFYLRAYKRITNVPTLDLLMLRWSDIRRIQYVWKKLPIWQN
jgi:O-antigen/teichoic acid export membrane protein